MGNRAALNRQRRTEDLPTWVIVVETPQLTAEDRKRIAREDAEIQRRREAYPLH